MYLRFFLMDFCPAETVPFKHNTKALRHSLCLCKLTNWRSYLFVDSLRERFPRNLCFLDKDCTIPSRGFELLPTAAFNLSSQHWICSSCFKINPLIPCENSETRNPIAAIGNYSPNCYFN